VNIKINKHLNVFIPILEATKTHKIIIDYRLHTTLSHLTTYAIKNTGLVEHHLRY